MPGIVGLITKIPRETAEAELRCMVEALNHEPFCKIGTWVNHSLGLYASWSAREHSFWARALSGYRRRVASTMFKRPLRIAPARPIISFTFDDVPKSALTVGGALLREHGLRATYYVALGLAGQESPTGLIFAEADLHEFVRQGHELGCHT